VGAACPAAALLVLGLASAGPAAAQEAKLGGVASAPPGRLILQPPAQVGALQVDPRPRRPVEDSECMPAWPCRLRLFGVIEKDGGIGLKGTALTW
jgi:hypothetical protein